MEDKKDIIRKIDEEIDYYGATGISGKRNPLIPTLIRAKLYILESEPIKHGRWVKKNNGITAECSNCGIYDDIDNHGYEGRLNSFEDFVKDFKFCPRCGAKMDGEESKQ